MTRGAPLIQTLIWTDLFGLGVRVASRRWLPPIHAERGPRGRRFMAMPEETTLARENNRHG